MSDPVTYQIPTPTIVECDVCGTWNKVTYWDDIRNGRWVRDSFTCPCGEYHHEIDGNALDRGAAQVLVMLFATGLALFTIGSISLLGGHLTWWPLALCGALLVFAVFIIALFAGANQGDQK